MAATSPEKRTRNHESSTRDRWLRSAPSVSADVGPFEIGSQFQITATVKPAGGEAYQVNFTQYIYPSAPFAAGEDVIVRVDPDDPNVVMIWGKG